MYYRQGKIRNSVSRMHALNSGFLMLFFAVGSEQAAKQSLRSFQVAGNVTIFWDGKRVI
jgi:small neutral amino acid transporter SnatA (MarC family)